MCIAKGSSMIRETIFENRFIHVSELKRLGADIAIHGNQALVRGKERLLAAPVMGHGSQGQRLSDPCGARGPGGHDGGEQDLSFGQRI